MAENIVVKECLTDAMIEAGEALTRKLDEMGHPPSLAMWFYDSEINDWRLLFSTPDIDTRGGFAVYGWIDEAIEQLGGKPVDPPFSAVGLLMPSDELARKLRAGAATGPGIVRRRLRRTVADGRYIEDALLYRAA